MEADCFQEVVRNKVHWDIKICSYRKGVSNNFRLEKGNFFASFYNFESRCKTTVALLNVGSNVHQETEIW